MEIAPDRYTLKGKVDAGGSGTVYKAQDEILNRFVAVKMLDIANEPNAIKRFFREAETLARVKSPYVVQVYDFGIFQGKYSIFMEFVEGQTLRERFKTGISWPEALKITVQIAQGLKAIHDAQLVHRDLKPENIIVNHRGAIITDFGLTQSQFDTRLTERHRIIGTPEYMAPEAQNGEFTHQSDIWALGKIMKEMSANASEEFLNIAYKAMEKNLKERYDSIRLLLIDLEIMDQRRTTEKLKTVVTRVMESTIEGDFSGLLAIFFIVLFIATLIVLASRL